MWKISKSSLEKGWKMRLEILYKPWFMSDLGLQEQVIQQGDEIRVKIQGTRVDANDIVSFSLVFTCLCVWVQFLVFHCQLFCPTKLVPMHPFGQYFCMIVVGACTLMCTLAHAHTFTLMLMHFYIEMLLVLVWEQVISVDVDTCHQCSYLYMSLILPW